MLALGYTPSNKHCELVLPTAGRPRIWVGNGPGQFLGSYVIGQVVTTRFVQ